MALGGLDKLAGLDMLEELELELVGVAEIELAEIELAEIELAEIELAELELVEVGALELAALELVGIAELVAFAALGPDLAGLSDLAEPAPLLLAELALGNDAEHCSK